MKASPAWPSCPTQHSSQCDKDSTHPGPARPAVRSSVCPFSQLAKYGGVLGTCVDYSTQSATREFPSCTVRVGGRVCVCVSVWELELKLLLQATDRGTGQVKSKQQIKRGIEREQARDRERGRKYEEERESGEERERMKETCSLLSSREAKQ